MATILMDKLLQTVINTGASDLHIAVGQPPVIRLHGRLKRLETKVLEADDTVSLMKQIAPDRCQQQLQEVGGADFAFAFGEQARFRVSIFKQKGMVGMVLRIIPYKMMSVESLGLPWPCVQLVQRPRGLFLVTGPTGSGKTTTLAALVNWLNEHCDHHIVTIEDPIEYFHTHKKSTINQREVGVDVPSFAEALRRVLRQDPDVIMVGEMRDLETTSAAITAAETGHVVFGTLHTNSADATINRVIDQFPMNQQEQIRTQLASSIIGILCQQLLPKIGGGRVAAFEMLVISSAIANLIRENKIFRIPSSIQTGAKEGMILLDDYLFNLWKDRKVTKEDALSKSNRPGDLLPRIERAEHAMMTGQDIEEEEPRERGGDRGDQAKRAR
jgi:twitching motility protein PilT